MTKQEIPVSLLRDKLHHIDQLLKKRDSELRKMTSGDFKFQRWLAIQQEFDGRVQDFEETVKILC